MTDDKLRFLVERIERLDAEKRILLDDIGSVYAEAKSNGFDPKIIRRLIKERARDADDLAEEENMLDIYRRALGMLASTPLGEAALRRPAARANGPMPDGAPLSIRVSAEEMPALAAALAKA